MQSEQQYEQLLMQYTQLRNGAEDIARMIEQEDYDSAITMLRLREPIFFNCKCIQKFLELTPTQQKEIDTLISELKKLELSNIKQLQKNMDDVQDELTKAQKSQKLQQMYDNMSSDTSGSMVNFEQ